MAKVKFNFDKDIKNDHKFEVGDVYHYHNANDRVKKTFVVVKIGVNLNHNVNKSQFESDGPLVILDENLDVVIWSSSKSQAYKSSYTYLGKLTSLNVEVP